MVKNKLDFIMDLPKDGPLKLYRQQASFNWKDMILATENCDLLRIKFKIWNQLKIDPLFQHKSETQSVDEQKRIVALQHYQLCRKYNFFPNDIDTYSFRNKYQLFMAINSAMYLVHPELSIKLALGQVLFGSSILTLGTDRHQKFYQAARDRKVLSCLALTEVAHGSNTKQMRTTATYDPSTQQFIINTPDFQAAKSWIGSLGKTAVLALLFAQLYTKGECHGLHAFIVPIRDPKTLKPYPGIVVGDVGEKIGVNGIDNGFIMFHNYQIPREYLLNRAADVTVDGEYKSSFQEQPDRILAAMLQNLTMGRMAIAIDAANTLARGVTIAIRYAAARRQFSAASSINEEEQPLLEYQLHQWRLFPLLASAYVLKVFTYNFFDMYLIEASKTNCDNVINSVAEIHAILSICKPLVTWTSYYGLSECREACGGHGYLKVAALGEIRANTEAACTYEGDNNVLPQQTSNWLIRQWRHYQQNGADGIQSPLNTIAFLKNATNVLKTTFFESTIDQVLTHQFIVESYEWLICWLLKETVQLQDKYFEMGECKFTVRNNTQVYNSRILSRIYGEYLALNIFWKHIHTNTNINEQCLPALINLYLLYGLFNLDKHSVLFYQAKVANDKFIKLIRDGILTLCLRIKPDAVALVDAFAYPDYVINSILGNADGQIYQHLQQHYFNTPGALARPHWWHQIIIPDAPDFKNILLSKL